VCGGVNPNEKAATPEVQAMCDGLRDEMLAALRRRGWNGVFKVFNAVAFKTQVCHIPVQYVVCCATWLINQEPYHLCASSLVGERRQLLRQNRDYRQPLCSRTSSQAFFRLVCYAMLMS